MKFRKNRYWMYTDDTHATLFHTDMGGKGTIIAREDEHIVVKWPRGTTWNGNYQDRAYRPAKTVVYRIIDDRDDMNTHPGPNTKHSFRVEECIEWDNTRKKAESP